jgi:hypothetical protein
VRQRVTGIDRPNNVDVRGDLAAVTERLKSRVRLFNVSESGVTEAGSFPVFEGQQGPAAAPMGIALYRRPRDGALFAVVGRKNGPASGYLWQYRIEGTKATKVREFGNFSGGADERSRPSLLTTNLASSITPMKAAAFASGMPTPTIPAPVVKLPRSATRVFS